VRRQAVVKFFHEIKYKSAKIKTLNLLIYRVFLDILLDTNMGRVLLIMYGTNSKYLPIQDSCEKKTEPI
jgi:hypothetical protein